MALHLLTTYAVLLAIITLASEAYYYPFQNPYLPWDERVNNLVSLLTVDEVIEQISRGGTGVNGPAPAIPRLGIGPYSWNTECVGGVADAGNATSFPQPIGMAASFDIDLQWRTANATSVEARAKYNDYMKHNQYGDHKGLSCFSPVINIMRHPLWGRAQETFGEDPYLSGQMGASFVLGVKGTHTRYIRASAGCKHFSVHAGPENIPVSRFTFDANVTLRDWHVTFLPAFQRCVRAEPYSIMCSYNRINGVPACANKYLLTEILRDTWGFKGYVVSDQDAIENIMNAHKYKNSTADTATAALSAGTNLELNSDNKNGVFSVGIPEALKSGQLTEYQIRQAAKPLFYTRMRLGEFDPPSHNPFSNLDLSVIQSVLHRDLSLTAAMKTFVLLKNANNLLPLTKNYTRVSIVGPMAHNPTELFGAYSANYDPKYTTTPWLGLQKLGQKTLFEPGCKDNSCALYNHTRIIQVVNGTELVVVCLGTGKQLECEGNDRADMRLPKNQTKLLMDVVNNAGNASIILLLFNAGPIEIPPNLLSKVSAILECFIPAQTAGEAILRILTANGPNSVPAGRLPFTWPKSMKQVNDITNYTMVNRTYRYWKHAPPLYPFGYGLSYTSFKYDSLAFLHQTIKAGETVLLHAQVRNTGSFDAEEVIQVYIEWESTEEIMPIRQLVGFRRVLIKRGANYPFNFRILPEQMQVYKDDVGFVIESGTIGVYVGGQQPNQFVTVGSNILYAQFNVTV